MHRTVIFDLGRVLIDFDFSRGYRALEGMCPYEACDIPRRLSGTGLVERFESGAIEPRDFVKQLSTALELQIAYDHFCEIWSSIFTTPLVPESMVERLGERYRLLLLSNTNAIHFDMLRERLTVLDRFDHLVLSYQVGAMKPRPEIYRAALEHAGCRPQECFYTDDILAYVDAARGFGIDAVQFRTVEQLERDMADRGIEY